jgi:hypothetical protein
MISNDVFSYVIGNRKLVVNFDYICTYNFFIRGLLIYFIIFFLHKKLRLSWTSLEVTVRKKSFCCEMDLFVSEDIK